ncbi:MAG TPA: TonB-dependent receptor, partial [Ktedonobacteraceae bacterium]|nr:TonB-dependent receptor [Ktedonobacteraceae bacterium]
WQHTYSGVSYGTVTLSDSEQAQNIDQEDQVLSQSYSNINAASCAISNSKPVYEEKTHDGQTTGRYDFETTFHDKLTIATGALARLYHIHYTIAQPLGQQSPFSTDPSRSDAISFSPDLLTGETAGYVQMTFHVNKSWNLGAGERFQTFALDGQVTATSRASSIYKLSEHTSIYASFGQYAQLPPPVYILSYPQNRLLLPMRAKHLILGSELWDGGTVRIGIEAYRKTYRDYPVSTEYPTLSLANMVDTLGQQFVWIPMASLGNGSAYGVDIYASGNITRHFIGQANIAYSRALFSGRDGKLRPGNFDFPVIINAAGIWRSGRKYETSFRYEYTTGRPYTPFDLPPSIQQNRPIYNLEELNAVRGPAYSRLDFQMDRNFFIRHQVLTIYAGLENAFNRRNFLGYAWMPHCDLPGSCGFPAPYTELHQMPLLPDFGVRFSF